MPAYEIINPSDPVTFTAEDDKVAILATWLLGSGRYGLKREDGTSLTSKTMLMFATEEQLDKITEEVFGATDLEKVIEDLKPKLAEAFESVMTFNMEERKTFDLARKNMTPEQFDKFRKELDDQVRTSLNAISERAWGMAKKIRER